MVAFVGIAATAFLLTLQPAFAASNIFARQSVNGTNLPISNSTKLPASCQKTSSCKATLNLNDTSEKALCTTAFANNVETCLMCVVNITIANSTGAEANGTSLTLDDLTLGMKAFLDGCKNATYPVTGVSSLPASTGTETAASTDPTSDASNLSMNAFGIIITSVLGAIALL